MGDFPSFASFYTAINGWEPFPWQERLAEQVARSGWPAEIGVPTGLGKTACIDIGVWALARQENRRTERSAPTRIWYLVNRRLLVDQAWTHGLDMSEKLRTGRDADGRDSPVVGTVGAALRRLTPLGAKDGPLQVSRLRGGAEIGSRPLEPSQPAIVFATVPMFASRWLFRGYGSSTSMRPVDAALAGIDSLVLLDEAHLARPLLALAKSAALCDIGEPATVIAPERSRPVMVALTATGERSDDRFDLDERDRAHPLVRQRIEARKPVTLLESSEKTLHRDLAERALKTLDPLAEGATCVVFVNTPGTARAVVHELRGLVTGRARGAEVLMATGRMRGREAAAVRTRLLDPSDGVAAGRVPAREGAPDLIVVATQTLEVGADLDFDVLVTETAGTRALIQRMGRLNRLGETSDASGAIVHPTDRKTWPVYGEEPVAVWEALHRAGQDDIVNLSASQIGLILGPPRDEPERVGELLPSHLWEWAKTSLPPMGEAPVRLFFEGFGDDLPRVSVCWRARLTGVGVRFAPGLRQAESLELPLWELREALKRADVGEVHRLADDRASLEVALPDALRPGDDVVLPAALGLYDINGWNPESGEEVLETAVLDSRVLPLSREVLGNLAPGFDARDLLHRLVDVGEDGLSKDEESDLIAELLDHLATARHHPWLTDEEWRAFLDGLGRAVMRPVDDVPFIADRPEAAVRAEVRADAFEELNFAVRSIALADHLDAVGQTAALIARSTGVADALISSLKTAGDCHDVGKRDPRFQRWLAPESESAVPRAKSEIPRHLIERARVAAQWPKGGRHELVSARILSEWLTAQDGGAPPWDPELVLHLVSTHHGHGRPLVRAVEDPSPPALTLEFEGKELTIASDVSLVDWSQPARFRALCERYGYWGLALLEAILRQSDHAVSSAGEVA